VFERGVGEGEEEMRGWDGEGGKAGGLWIGNVVLGYFMRGFR